MGFAKTHSGQSHYLKGQIIDIEVDLSRGLHSFSIVGLADKSIDEAKDRISAAIKNSGFVSPKQKNHRVVISLAPAHVRKEGTHFDLAMAIGYLLAGNEIDFDPTQKIFVGELSLDGFIRKVYGVLPVAIEAVRLGFKEIFVPAENLREVKTISGIKIFGVEHIRDLIEHLDHKNKFFKNKIEEEYFHSSKLIDLDSFIINSKFNCSTPSYTSSYENFGGKKVVKLEEIVGQTLAKRALEISAAGGHNIIMSGPPGTGKTMLAHAFRSLLPKLNFEDSLEVTSIHSTAGFTSDVISDPPFRAPHHTSSYSALIGGGTIPRPGEITLAHCGILFLDEFPEFDRRVIETLRQPLEEQIINIVRVKGSVHFPARFILIAAMNPCPCGFSTSRKNKCLCTAGDISNYQKKISGPILDRIDLSVDVGDIEHSDFVNSVEQAKNSKTQALSETECAVKRIYRARERQAERFSSIDHGPKLNNGMSGSNLSLVTATSIEASKALLKGTESFKLSMRAYHRVWRVARTIADLDDSEQILESHVLEAFQFRRRHNA